MAPMSIPATLGTRQPMPFLMKRLLSTHLRTDNNTIRAVLGNDVAIKAAREGRTNPWPEGAVLAKMVWKARKHE